MLVYAIKLKLAKTMLFLNKSDHHASCPEYIKTVQPVDLLFQKILNDT